VLDGENETEAWSSRNACFVDGNATSPRILVADSDLEAMVVIKRKSRRANYWLGITVWPLLGDRVAEFGAGSGWSSVAVYSFKMA